MNPTQKQFSLNRAASRKQIPISAECVRAGPVQARKFSWNRCAAETLDVYRAVMRNGV